MTLFGTLSDDEREQLAGEYVLGTLSPSQHRAVQSQLEADAALSRAVDAWAQRLLPLARLAEPIEPPARLWLRIEKSLALGRAPGPADWCLRAWQSLDIWRGVAATGLASSMVMAFVLWTQVPANAPQFMVVLVAPQDRAPGWVIQANDAQHISLIPLGTYAIPPDKALQFWTKAEGWKAPVSLGLVKPGQRIQIPLNALPALTANQLFELTVEPANGSPTGKPTGPIQFVGRAVPIT
jgi:anti-sigma-K factor RskA